MVDITLSEKMNQALFPQIDNKLLGRKTGEKIEIPVTGKPPKKRLNTHSKGVRAEAFAKKILRNDGYIVEQKNWNRFASKDFFGLFDILAIKGSLILFIQVKSERGGFNKAKKDIKAWIKENKVSINAEVWLYEGKNLWTFEKV